MTIPPATTLNCLFLDINSYFASVEQQLNPALRGKPVIVVPVMSEHTCAIAASVEAKRFGISTGTPVPEARKRCPQLRIAYASHERYTRIHASIVKAVEQHLPITTVASIDEMHCRLIGDEREEARALALARHIKMALQTEVGALITCSIGIAANPLLAKIASDMHKPDGLVVLRPETLPGPLLSLALRDIPGIGRNMEQRLFKAGIYTMEQLWNLPCPLVRRIWGGIQGERFWYLLHGHEVSEQATATSSIGHSHVLDPIHRHPATAYLVTRRLLLKAASRLRREGYLAGALHLQVRCLEDGFELGARLAHTQDNETFLVALRQLWQHFLRHARPHAVRKTGVVLSGLRLPEQRQLSLFPDTQPSALRQKRQAALAHAMDHLNQRYGRNSVTYADLLPVTLARDISTKIAFNRVPDFEEFRA